MANLEDAQKTAIDFLEKTLKIIAHVTKKIMNNEQGMQNIEGQNFIIRYSLFDVRNLILRKYFYHFAQSAAAD